MERFIPVECFRKKGNTFEESGPSEKYLRKNNAKHLQGVRFPKLVSMQCVSFLIGSVRGRLTTQLQPIAAGEKELSFVVGTYVFRLLA